MDASAKIRILRIYQIILKHSDADHKISKKDIKRLLEEEYQITVAPNTLSADLNDLIDSCNDIDVEHGVKNQYFYTGHIFDIADIRLLADAVNSSRFITGNLTRAMIEKLLTQVPDTVAKQMQNDFIVDNSNYVKSTNKQVPYIVDTVNNAITSKHKIAFIYTDYMPDKSLIDKHDGKIYTISPYNLVWDGEFYYLIGLNDGEEKPKTYRIDRIKSRPEILQEPIIPPPKSYNANQYRQRAFQMLGTDTPPETVTILCKNWLMRYVIDQFGINVKTEIVDCEHFKFSAIVYPSATFLRWIFGWSGSMKILGPENVIEEYRKMIRKAEESIEE